MEDKLKLAFLDHVAICVKDLDVSAEWYEEVLGLKKSQLPEWGVFPIFMLSNKTGVALFPANTDDPPLDLHSRNVKIDHFAFTVTKENFELARKKYTDLKFDFSIQDHHYFHSI